MLDQNNEFIPEEARTAKETHIQRIQTALNFQLKQQYQENDSSPITIGRGDDQTIPIPKETLSFNTVSRKHAQIVLKDDGEYYLQDLRSRNGTFYREGSEGNWIKVSNDPGEEESIAQLQPGYQIRLGDQNNGIELAVADFKQN